MWRPDGHDGSRSVSRNRRSIPPPVRVCSANVPGSGMGFGSRLRLRGKLAVALDTPGSHRGLVWILLS